MSEFIKHEACPNCGSSDNLARYSDGHGYCFGCGYRESSTEDDNYNEDNYTMTEQNNQVQVKGFNGALPERNISRNIATKYGVRIAHGEDGKVNKHYYPYYHNKTGDLLGFKERDVKTKSFGINGTNRGAGLFGQNIFKAGGKYLTITEGELDALAVAEMFDGKWAVVSLKNGANGALRDIKDNLDYIESFDNVVLCFDQDDAGKEAIESVRDVISPDKLRICTLPMKDASDMLMSGRVKDFTDAWWNAKEYTPDGIVRGADTWEFLQEEEDVVSIPYPWLGLNELTYGFRQKELVTITSGSGMGKSSVIKELESYILNNTDDSLAVIHLEESVGRAVRGIMSIDVNLPLHLPEYKDYYTKEEEYALWKKTVGDKDVYFHNHFGSMAEEKLINTIRSYAKSYDCKWIVLDHISIVVSEQEGILDERKAIDAIMTKLRKIVQETGVGMFVISHLKRPQGKAHEEGGQVSLSELRGSASIAQLSDMVIGLERNQQAEEEQDRNTTTFRVIKNRFAGLTGKAGQVLFNKHTGRLKEV